MLNPKSEIDEYVMRFLEDEETKRTEKTVQELIATFRENKEIEQVLFVGEK